MAGARGHNIGTIYSRMHGLLQTEVLPLHKRPVWYDVWQAFPPKVQPVFNRPIPGQTVQDLVYPEDFVRVKFIKTYLSRETLNLKRTGPNAKSDAQLFVETYIKMQTPGSSVEEVLQMTEKALAARGKQFQRKVPLNTDTLEQIKAIQDSS